MVTTIIPTIGRDTLWTRALPSVYAQAGDWDCIVVGDGVTVEVDHPRVRCITVPRTDEPDPLRAWRHGGVDALNAGLAAAEGDWVAYLADDDAYRPGHHAALTAHIGGVDVVYGQSQVHGINGTIIVDRLFGEHWPLDPYDVVQGSYIMRRSAVVPATKPDDRTWDAAWWDDVNARGLRTKMVTALVHDYYPAEENAYLHGIRSSLFGPEG